MTRFDRKLVKFKGVKNSNCYKIVKNTYLKQINQIKLHKITNDDILKYKKLL